MSASVNLHDKSGPVLAQHASNKPQLTTDVYKQQLHAANLLIKRVIHANMGHKGN
jgi:membrane fusion protein (multidrug efflux system)